MSSADSSMLSASTMITRNVYQVLLRPAASELEVVITLRIMICTLGSLSVYMALSVNSVFDLWTLCSDIVYVLLFPQLLCVFYFKETNAYGSVLAFVVGGVFRCLCGEPSMNVPVVVRLPLYDPEKGQRFPFRLLCMALGLCTLLIGSFAATTLFRRGLLSDRFDVFQCFVKRPPTSQLRNPPIDHAMGTGSTGSDNTAGAKHAGNLRPFTTDVTVTEKEAPNTTLGVSKDNRRSSLAVPVQARDGVGGNTTRKSSLAPDKVRSDASEVHRPARLVASGSSGAIGSSSRALEKSLAEGATGEKTLRKTSMAGGARGGSKEPRKKSIAGGSEGSRDGGPTRH
ncbi:hypothetical protein HPB52_003895 [Rhipicephalus sanguineus]|uniref:Uncharacterized protein n=2 Tax=Rhipicephalus sanguineus TaxID=34632 RepID=A0A9D4PVD2_RHISA|nr:hypothetical protein HPB52_003895 [Rhipicephalus sanguineus]